MTNKLKKILAEISAGELLDKISILEIKLKKITDKGRLQDIKKDYDILKKVQNNHIKPSVNVNRLLKEINGVNQKLWDIEDKLRVCEKDKNFGKDFIELARGVYINNDKRAKIKSEINRLLGSNIIEIKQYIDY